MMANLKSILLPLWIYLLLLENKKLKKYLWSLEISSDFFLFSYFWLSFFVILILGNFFTMQDSMFYIAKSLIAKNPNESIL
jgi:hypothetical protein